MQPLAGETLTALGRMTVAATDLEYLLAWLAAGSGAHDQRAGAQGSGGARGGVRLEADQTAIFAAPGEPLRAARAVVGPELLPYIDAAGTQLAQSQAALRVLWQEGGRRDPAMFDEVTDRLVRLRETLGDLALRAR